MSIHQRKGDEIAQESMKKIPTEHGGARRKVLPPITTKPTNEKTSEQKLDAVLPVSNNYSRSRNGSSDDDSLRGNLPLLLPNAPMTKKDSGTSSSRSRTPEISPVEKNTERPCASNSDLWSSFEDESGLMLAPSETWDKRGQMGDTSSNAFPSTAGLCAEPPISPLPLQVKLANEEEEDCKVQGRDIKTKVKGQQSPSGSPKDLSRHRTKPRRSSPSEVRASQGTKRATCTTTVSFKQFKNDLERYNSSQTGRNKKKALAKLQEFYKNSFESFKSINDTFKKRTDTQTSKSLNSQDKRPSSHHEHSHDPQVQQKFVTMMHDALLDLPQEIQKQVLKGIINCLLNEWRGAKTEVEVRAYFILLQNPLFARSSTHVIYAHLLRQTATLHDKEQSLLTHWLRRLTTPRFRPIVERIHQFVTLRLFPDKQQELPPMSKCPWWIPSAMKVLSLLYNANNLVKPRLISYREFYNISLDHIDVMAELKQWQTPASHPGFTFCHHPYVLSLCAKRHLLKKDQERQMVRTARDELVDSVRRRPTRPPDVNQLFLNVKVRRQHLLQDSLAQIYGNRKQLKKKLRVEFLGEPGYDMGGLTKEWFLLLLRQVLSPDYGTFIHNEKSRTYWFATSETDNFSDYFLVGVLVGLAVYNSITLDLRFPLVLYRKLLSPPQLPELSQVQNSQEKSPTVPVGLVSVSLDDLKDIDPDMVHGFEELLMYEGDIEEDIGITFLVTKEEFSITRNHLLKRNGDKCPVTNSNRREYIQCYLNWLINKSVYRQFNAFYQGFHTVCDSSVLSLLCPEEVETLACGNPVFDLRDLKKYTSYEGFNSNDPTILYFWEVTMTLPREMQKKLLHFCTGSDRVPVGGMQDLKFKIIRAPTAQNMLPMAHTCFNQLLLPPYGSRSQLEQKLTIAISNAEGFGLE